MAKKKARKKKIRTVKKKAVKKRPSHKKKISKRANKPSRKKKPLRKKPKTARKALRKKAKTARKKPLRKAKKPARKSKVIVVKREVHVKKKKKQKKKKEVIVLTKEEMERISDILSRPVIRQLLVDVGGENAIEIVRNFNTGMSDEDISKSLNLKISDVRAALNRLHSEGIVAYNREKDSETGWYSYSWYLNMEKVEKWACENIKKLENPEENGGEYYVCPTCGNSTIVDFENALDRGFRCEICNHSLEYLDEKKKEELGMVQMRKRL